MLKGTGCLLPYVDREEADAQADLYINTIIRNCTMQKKKKKKKKPLARLCEYNDWSEPAYFAYAIRYIFAD